MRPIVKCRDTLRSSVQKRLNRLRFASVVGPKNQVLDGGPAVLRDVAMATNSGKQFDSL